jgi:hypothetical protein
MPRVDVARVFANVGHDDGLAILRDPADQPLAELEPQLHHLFQIVAAHGLGVEDERGGAALAEVRVAADDVDARRVVRQERVERVHHLRQNFFEVERTADLLRDLKQQAQLVRHRQLRSVHAHVCGLFGHKQEIIAKDDGETG